jgi:UDP-2,3-diacylglucosamine hydrolase
MHGNRDFLVGEHYLSRCGMQALPDPWHGLLFGVPTALSHGDMLCTDDSAYQQFRHMSRNPQWQSAFLSKPLAERVAYAQHLRAESMKNKAAQGNLRTNGQADIMDVNAQAVRNALEGHWPNGAKTPLAARLIHGHTHRPAVHHIKLENGNEAQRWVLPDWDFDHAQSVRGHLLRVDKNGVAVQVLSSN